MLRPTKKVACANCQVVFSKPLHHVKQNIRLKHRFFCSLKCHYQHKTRAKLLVCENPKCFKKFLRNQAGISLNNYCSRSCAAKINNQKYPRHPPRSCAYCKKLHNRADSLYCSLACGKAGRFTYTKDEIVNLIHKKYRELGRIPSKREVKDLSDKCAHLFGSWNKAIVAAGFTPNRSHDDRMYKRARAVANDGHVCDSVSELIIDNWLTKNNIAHTRSVRYPSSNHTADWAIAGDSVFIEYFGLANESPRYDRAVREKLRLCKKHGIKLIKILPSNLYPKKNLGATMKLIENYENLA